MAGWFTKLMHDGHAPARRATEAAGLSQHEAAGTNPEARDARYDAVVQALRDREAEDRAGRERRQRGYRQSVEGEAGAASGDPGAWSPMRLHRFRTRVPCRATPAARTVLDQLKRQFPRGTVSFQQIAGGRQAVMLTRVPGSEPKLIGWVEHCVQGDATRCNVRHQGLTVETDGGTMLVLRFRYPHTPVRACAGHDAVESTRAHRHDAPVTVAPDGLDLACGPTDEVARVDFAEIRPVLDPRPAEKGTPPRLVWVTRRERETMQALGSRDFEAFYVRLKLEVLAGVWSALSDLIARGPSSRWHRGAHYTVVRDTDASTGRIHQRTLDDSGRAVDIGANRTYDAAHATDILLLYLDGDILADVADIYFTLRSLGTADAYFLKEELFRVIRRFWSGARSLESRYGSELPTVIRMSQRAVPMPAQAPLLTQDWLNLRQALVDRYGEGGRKAAGLVGQELRRSRGAAPAWPFATFATGDVNLGLRFVHRQEWRHLGAQRGEVLRTVAPTAARAARPAQLTRQVETIVRRAESTRSLDAVVDEALEATLRRTKWPRDLDGSIATGARGLAVRSDMESEGREGTRDISTRLSDTMVKMVGASRDTTVTAARAGSAEALEPSSDLPADDTATYVYSRLQHRYEVLTRPVEIQNVVLVAEKLPTPAEIDRSWVRRHDWILAKVLLDESYRDALETIGVEGARLDEQRARLCEHLRANILHYQRAIWQQEDPQQRAMRYRKSGKKVPLDWRFELESGGALTIHELGDRLAATSVDGQFATYSTGRAVELDEVIDPSGPIGYHGNYAVYRMRPELGSADAFAMLHFFKSPWLRPGPETGVPEVEDPLQIRIAEDPAMAGAPGRASARFRRERARQVAVDTDGVVIDVVRTVEAPAEPEQPAIADDAFEVGETPEGFRLVLDGAAGVTVLRLRAHTDEDVAAIVHGEGVRMPALLAGSAVEATCARDGEAAPPALAARPEAGVPALSAGHAHDPVVERAIVAGDVGARGLLAGGTDPGADDQAIRARETEAPRLTAISGGATHPPERAIVARGGARPPMLRLAERSATHDPESVPWIAAVQGAASTLGALVRGLAAHADAPEIERAILAEGNIERTPSLRAGAGAPRADERMIIVRGEGAPRLVASASGKASPAQERAILARSEGRRAPDLQAGRARGKDGERLIVARSGGGSRLTAIAGGEAANPRDRVIIARGEGWLRPSLIAG